MLPSRGPVRVTLEATGSTGVQCKPPTQVKILRRPKPVAGASDSGQANKSAIVGVISTSETNLTQPTYNNKDKVDYNKGERNKDNRSTNVDNVFEEKLLTESADSLLCRKQTGTTTRAPSDTKLVTMRSSAQQSHNHQTTHTSLNTQQNYHHQHQSALSNSEKSNNKTKKSIKTYQERADEYAKARLRILGSAFPENDDSSTITDDVNRILNLESDASSSNGLSGDRSSSSAPNILIPTNSDVDNIKRDDSNFRNDNLRCYTYSSRGPGT